MRLTTFLVCIAALAMSKTTELSSLSLLEVKQGYGEPQMDASIVGNPISIAGKLYERGVGTHAPSTWTLALGGHAKRLSGHVGLTDSPGNEIGSCEFIVREGSRILWQSGVMREGDAAKPVDLNLSGLKEITLEVTTGGDQNWSDHAAWCCRIEHDGAPLTMAPEPVDALVFKDIGPVGNGSNLDAAEWGIVPNTKLDAGPALRALLTKLRETKDVTVNLRPGTYILTQRHTVRREWPQSNTDVHPLRNYSVILEKLEGVTLTSKEATFVCTGSLSPLAIVDCERITIEGIHIDWERPTTSQAAVISSDGRSAVIRPHAETPLSVREGRIYVTNGLSPNAPSTTTWYGSGIWAVMEWDPATGCPAYQRGDIGGAPSNAVDLGDGTIRVDVGGFKAGHVMILRHDPRTHCGVLVHRSNEVTLRRTYLYASCGLGYLLQHSRNLSLIDTHTIPRPGSGRLFSGHDDGFQISGCGGRVDIRNCSFAGLLDDPINVHGTYLDVTRRVDNRTLEVRFAQLQSQNQPWADAGDEVTFSNRANLLRKGAGKVVSWKLNPSVGSGRQLAATSTGLLTFDRDLPAEVDKGWVAENMTMSPSVEIRDCKFLGNRARGLLVTTPKPVIIENNLFRSSGAAILINGDCNGWFESGTVTDVTIRGNRFEDCLLANYQFCDGVISIIPTNAKVEGPVHRNIRIEGNTFVMFDAPLLYARATEGLRFADNRIIRDTARQPWHYRKFALTLEHCSGVVIEGNTAEGELVSREVHKVNSPDTRISPSDILR